MRRFWTCPQGHRLRRRLDTFLQVVQGDPVPPAQLNPKVPRDLESICLTCLQ